MLLETVNNFAISDIVTGADFNIIAAHDTFHVKLSCSGFAFFRGEENDRGNRPKRRTLHLTASDRFPSQISDATITRRALLACSGLSTWRLLFPVERVLFLAECFFQVVSESRLAQPFLRPQLNQPSVRLRHLPRFTTTKRARQESERVRAPLVNRLSTTTTHFARSRAHSFVARSSSFVLALVPNTGPCHGGSLSQ